VIRVALSEQARPALESALAVLAALPAPIRATVRAVTAGSPDDVRLTVGRSTVIWGSAERSDRKAAIYAVLRRTPATVYDLSSPDTPVLR
jgi:cell division protein FtsQ